MEYDPKTIVKNIDGLREAFTSKDSSSVTFLIDESLHGVIPEPYPSSHNLPDWYKNMPLYQKDSETGYKKEEYTVKGCRPFMQGLTAGWILPLPTDIHIVHQERGIKITFRDFDEFYALQAITNDPGIGSVSDGVYENGTVIKNETPWYISVPNGYSVLEIPPLNRQNNIFSKYFSSFGGIWDADMHLGTINPLSLMNIPEGTDVVIPAGTPISQLIVIDRTSILNDASVQCLNEKQKKSIDKYGVLSRAIFHLYSDYLWNPIKASRISTSSNKNNSGCPFSKE
jgi:sulfur relay (sulfurtransferase) DsrF/TusC family protein